MLYFSFSYKFLPFNIQFLDKLKHALPNYRSFQNQRLSSPVLFIFIDVGISLMKFLHKFRILMSANIYQYKYELISIYTAYSSFRL